MAIKALETKEERLDRITSATYRIIVGGFFTCILGVIGLNFYFYGMFVTKTKIISFASLWLHNPILFVTLVSMLTILFVTLFSLFYSEYRAFSILKQRYLKTTGLKSAISYCSYRLYF